jgi:hypothetical protein
MSKLDELAYAWKAAKRDEDQAKEKRITIEEAILAEAAGIPDMHKLEGSATAKLSDGKLTVTYKLVRSVDQDAIKSEWQNLPAHVQPVFSWSADINTAELRKLDDGSAKIAARFITSKSAKPSIKVEF